MGRRRAGPQVLAGRGPRSHPVQPDLGWHGTDDDGAGEEEPRGQGPGAARPGPPSRDQGSVGRDQADGREGLRQAGRTRRTRVLGSRRSGRSRSRRRRSQAWRPSGCGGRRLRQPRRVQLRPPQPLRPDPRRRIHRRRRFHDPGSDCPAGSPPSEPAAGRAGGGRGSGAGGTAHGPDAQGQRVRGAGRRPERSPRPSCRSVGRRHGGDRRRGRGVRSIHRRTRRRRRDHCRRHVWKRPYRGRRRRVAPERPRRGRRIRGAERPSGRLLPEGAGSAAFHVLRPRAVRRELRGGRDRLPVPVRSLYRTAQHGELPVPRAAGKGDSRGAGHPHAPLQERAGGVRAAGEDRRGLRRAQPRSSGSPPEVRGGSRLRGFGQPCRHGVRSATAPDFGDSVLPVHRCTLRSG